MRTETMHVLSPEIIDDLYPRYARAWHVLLLEASARHVLTADEFREEMRDARFEKIVVIDDADQIVAMTTLTTDMAVVPWINPTYYQHRFPEHAGRGALFYLGYTFVDVEHRRTGALRLMGAAVNARLAEARGVIGFDICGYGMDRGIGRRLERMFYRSTEIMRMDTQTYFVADYREPLHRDWPAYTVTSLAERADLVTDVLALLTERWPAYTLVGTAGHGVDLDTVLLGLPDHQLLLLDGDGALCGVALSMPITWDGETTTLPTGWDDGIRAGATLLESGGAGDTLFVLSITVSSTLVRRGLAAQLIAALKELAVRDGAHSVISPIRPVEKARYPLIPIDDYVEWTAPDGEPYDPWLRLHLRLGAEVVSLAHESMVVTGTVAEWEGWLGTRLPGSGDFVIDRGLVPLHVDRGADTGRYVEPNVWIRYRVGD
jgi:GNAT superfamily N-acetyltransferase